MKISSSILFILIFTFFGCKKLDELTHFDVDYNFEFTLPAFSGLNLPDDIEFSDLVNDTESTFEINDTRKDLVEGAILKKFHITILKPDTASFKIAKDIEVYVNADNLNEILVAWIYDIPNDIGNHLELKTTNRDLKKYLISDEITIRMKTTTIAPILEDYRIDLQSTVDVDAKILGI